MNPVSNHAAVEQARQKKKTDSCGKKRFCVRKRVDQNLDRLLCSWRWVRKMTSTNRRTELATEITALHQEQIESLRDVTFTGWTPEEKAEHERRKDRLAELQRELNDLL